MSTAIPQALASTTMEGMSEAQRAQAAYSAHVNQLYDGRQTHNMRVYDRAGIEGKDLITGPWHKANLVRQQQAMLKGMPSGDTPTHHEYEAQHLAPATETSVAHTITHPVTSHTSLPATSYAALATTMPGITHHPYYGVTTATSRTAPAYTSGSSTLLTTQQLGQQLDSARIARQQASTAGQGQRQYISPKESLPSNYSDSDSDMGGDIRHMFGHESDYEQPGSESGVEIHSASQSPAHTGTQSETPSQRIYTFEEGYNMPPEEYSALPFHERRQIIDTINQHTPRQDTNAQQNMPRRQEGLADSIRGFVGNFGSNLFFGTR